MPEQLNFDHDVQNCLASLTLLEDHNIRLRRQNVDQRRSNTHGIQLIELCKTNNLFIGNDRLDSDIPGKATTTDGSLIEYILASPLILTKI